VSEELYRATVRISPDTTGFREEAESEINAAVPDRKSVRIDADTAAAQAQVAALDEEVKKVERDSRSAQGNISKMGVGLAAALPALPTVLGGITALGAAFTAAGTAGIGFGVVVESAFKQATKAQQELLAAQSAVDNATTSASRTTALEKQAALIKELGPNVIALAQAEKDVGTQWKTFTDSFTPDITKGVSEVSRLASDVLPQLQPMIANTFGVMDTLLRRLDQAATSQGGRSFFSWLATEGPRDLEGLAVAAGHFGSGLAHIAEAFTPVEHQLIAGIDNITAKFSTWAGSLSSSAGFQKFLDTLAKDGPMLVHTLGDVAVAFGHIGGALGVLLPYELRFLDDLAKIVSGHPAVAAALAGLFTGFEAFKVVSQVTGPISTLWDLLKGANAWMAGTALSTTAVATSTAAVGAAATAADAPASLFLGTVGAYTPLATGGAGALNFFASAEATVGTTAAAAEPEVAALGGTIAATAASASNLLGLLGKGGLAGMGVVASLAGVSYFDKAGSSQIKISGAGADEQSLEQQVNQLNSTLKVPYLGGKTWTKDQALQFIAQNSTAASDANLARIGGGSGVSASDIQMSSNTYQDQVPGQSSSYFGNPDASSTPDYYSQFLKGLNDPANMLPLTGGGGGKAAATAAQNLAIAQADVLGLNIMGALAQGIATGTNPLTQAFSNLNQKLTGPAQTIGTALEQVFNAALAAGQKARNSLLGDVTGPSTMGSITNVTMGPDGKLVSNVQSPLLGNFANTLNTDQRFVTDISKAKKLGLNNDLLQQFVNAGPSSLSNLDSLVSGGAGDVGQLNKIDNQILGLGNAYGAQQAADQRNQMIELLGQLLAATKTSPAQMAQFLNGTAKAGQQLAAATPGLGMFTRG
jgi:hypothetical protein